MGQPEGLASSIRARVDSPEPPKHATPTSHCIGGTTQQKPDALLDRMTDRSHHVKHVRTGLREWIRIQSRVFEVTLVDGRLAALRLSEGGRLAARTCDALCADG